MKPTYNLVIQFKDKPILVFSKTTFENALAMIDLHSKELISVKLERR